MEWILDLLPIIISFFAVLFTLLLFLDNRKKTELLEKNLLISESQQKEKNEKKELLTLIIKFNEVFKDLTEVLDYGSSDIRVYRDDIINYIHEKLSQNKKQKLTITFRTFEMVFIDNKTPKMIKLQVSDLDNFRSFKEKVNKISPKLGTNYSLRFEILPPSVIKDDSFELVDFFRSLYPFKMYIDDLKNYSFVINSLDDEIIQYLEERYEYLINILYNHIKQKTYEFEFTLKTKPSKVEVELREMLGFESIKSEFEKIKNKTKINFQKIKEEIFKTL